MIDATHVEDTQAHCDLGQELVPRLHRLAVDTIEPCPPVGVCLLGVRVI
jgi:hypothetical protein